MRHPLQQPVLGALFLTIAIAPSLAWAQDLALGKAQFARGLEEMEAGHYDAACPALAESYRMDPRAGTLFTLAECENKRGKLATASARYADYLALFATMSADQQQKQHGRDALATAQKATIGPRVPQLTVVLPANAPKGIVVSRDNVTLSEASLGVPLPIDPGEHVVSATVPGQPSREVRVTLAAGEKKQVEVPLGGPATPVAGVEATPSAAAPPPPPPPATVAPPPLLPPTLPNDPGKGRRTTAYWLGGVGVAGLAAGGVLGGLMFSQKSTVDQNCVDKGGGVSVCKQPGVDAAHSAQTYGWASTIAVVGGIAAVGGAVVLYTTAPQKPSVGWLKGVLRVGADGAQISLQGAY